MKAGIKYCGGCNPAYRREKVEEILRGRFQNVHFFHISSGDLEGLKEADVVVCISGCKKGCAQEAVESEIRSGIENQNCEIPLNVMSVDEETRGEAIIAEFKKCLGLM